MKLIIVSAVMLVLVVLAVEANYKTTTTTATPYKKSSSTDAHSSYGSTEDSHESYSKKDYSDYTSHKGYRQKSSSSDEKIHKGYGQKSRSYDKGHKRYPVHPFFRVAFSAVLHQSNAVLKSQEPVLFDNVYVNAGNGYDKATGLFTVPKGAGGIYYFEIHVTSYDKQEARVVLQKKSKGGSQTDALVRAVAICENGDSASVLVELKPGEGVIPVVVLGTNAAIKANLQSSFLGYRLYF